ncbi:hypothetical protein DTO013E5_10135 [Penicillium roqueforti]|nr:hypothetical protein DTO012A1_8743 [Penicillium roqueforti]KAI2738920.1 hypothetical protein DTO013F2_9474 [Penicillium roqueforti]KAI2756351.1 hypothetical protein DTO006G1_7991 [Penicillium roqueforti]KAI2765995.1 hypothetical protein DTO012A8_8786 [Penicillium roqueforti]KAI3196068.1 hypothetical protein DTO013E5_10135 [Penicillium roqueforti]
MDEIAEVVRHIGRQQAENVCYRTCYALLKQLQDLVGHLSEDLIRLHQADRFSSGDDDLYAVYQVAERMRGSVRDLLAQAHNARTAYEDICAGG